MLSISPSLDLMSLRILHLGSKTGAIDGVLCCLWSVIIVTVVVTGFTNGEKVVVGFDNLTLDGLATVFVVRGNVAVVVGIVVKTACS